VLKIMLTGSNTLALSWSSFSPGFTLQTNADLTGTNWAPVRYLTSPGNNPNHSVPITPPPTGNVFFRLIQ
jgi:hypothetical protein